jgi:hypothetical protein
MNSETIQATLIGDLKSVVVSGDDWRLLDDGNLEDFIRRCVVDNEDIEEVIAQYKGNN